MAGSGSDEARQRDRAARQQDDEARQCAADEKTVAVERQIKVLDEMLTSALRLAPLSFESLLVPPVTAEFDPGALGVAEPAPQWPEFAPAQPGGRVRLRRSVRLFRARHRASQLAAARARFDAAQSEHRRRESERQRALAVAKAQHDREVTEERAKAARHNAFIAARRAAFASGDTESVEWFVSRVLDASPYPDVFPHRHRVVYRPHNRDVVVEFELPPPRIVPSVRAFRYVRTRDTIEPLPRPEHEIKRRYRTLISAIALRSVHEIFSAATANVVTGVVFNGRVSSVDRATGKPVRPHLLSVSVDRSGFSELVLTAVEPVACLGHLNAIASPDPYALVPVEPFTGFDRGWFSMADGADVGPAEASPAEASPAEAGPAEASPAGAGRNLLTLGPAEFEHLVRRLFGAMGAGTWTPVPARDGTVSAVVTSKNVFSGGLCVVHATRRTGLVGLDAVHALTSAMAGHNAATGVMVTTSWFGRAGEEYARRNRITLINGAELKQLIKEHLDIDVVPGASPPRVSVL